MQTPKRPSAAGLYDPAFEHDACGVAFVARLNGRPTNEVLRRAFVAIDNMEHRGAEGADPDTGDGAGILLQLPDAFLRETARFELPEAGRYGVAVCYLPREDPCRRRHMEELLEDVVEREGQTVLGWRDVPTRFDGAGPGAQRTAPYVKHLFVGAAAEVPDQAAFERKLYVIRRVAELASENQLIIPTFSSRTIVYKGMLTAPQLEGYFPDLEDRRMATALAIVHSRFSTNTFPSWELAHPYRMIAHNGEVNTLRGNVNWMCARESELSSELFGDDLQRILPVVQPGGSDSATLDNVLELLVLSGRSLPHALMMMIPEPYQGRADMTEELKGFYDYHGSLMEPWDGPAAVAFTDGRVIGATLDRNGLRPGRWIQTSDGYVVMASEAGVLPLPAEEIERRGRLQPGHLLLVDLEQHRIVGNAEIKGRVAAQKPYRRWYAEQAVRLRDLPERSPRVPRIEPLRPRQVAFGYTQEELRVLLAPMSATGEEPTGSMGNDGALAVLSDRRPPLFSYFKQLFAQVTNPPIDPLRETIVMSLASGVGRECNLLDETPEHAHELSMDQPILRNSELEKVRQVSPDVFRAHTIDITWPVSEGIEGMPRAVERICAEASRVIEEEDGSILILSDRNLGRERAAIPSLLATASVHHYLVRAGTRLRVGLVVESGEPREVHHMACLIGYGASAVNPYLAFETLADLHRSGRIAGDLSLGEAEAKLIKAIGKGLLKTISKMGISTIGSYCGAQIFEAVGLDPRFVSRHFSGTPSRIGGVGMEVIARETLDRHLVAYPARRHERRVSLAVGGVYAWRRGGEHHAWNPETVPLLQRAVRGGGGKAYAEYARLVNEGNAQRSTLRGLLQIRDDQAPIPVEEVEPSTEIVKRFVTGAMSLGSISPESHETLAIAMNRLGGKSNTGEGGEDPRRYVADPNGDRRRSSIKQVASARFGVTTEYLVNADQLQIKMAQGAKPGEGGQLPGHKVDPYIAKLRFSTPGVSLISPPPHHDIYSIEDLKQLIYDLRCANPEATVSVKLAAEVGVGTVAAGVAKAGADHVVIAGHDGGTGASPLSSIQSAGVPWEIGLAETQQVLLMNDLRSRITVQADGQMRTGRDVVIAGLLGAEEMGFSTAPLIAVGCIMMRVCHLNTCPVGIATQDPELRRRFAGTPEHVVTYFLLVAEEARRIMASLGVATFADLIGRADLLESRPAIDHWKAQGVDLTELLRMPEVDPDSPRRKVRPQSPVLHNALDHDLIERARPALERGRPVRIESGIRNVNRTVGGLLSSAIIRAHGAEGLPEGTVNVLLDGSAGQSFGAWLAPGVTLTLRGDANDYVGKGLCGGIVAVMPPPGAPYRAEDNVVVGNTVLYGATGGRAFFRGLAGERFAVRNSGASAVVEGLGDHGCEYMTGGRVVVLGPTGRNFGAGMSGGIAYVLDEEGSFASRCNMDLVDLDPLDEADEIELRDLVGEHYDRTGSAVAVRLLARWPEALAHFVKVMPRDYKRALREQAEREAAERPLALDGASANGAGRVPTAPRAVGESHTVAATEGR